MLRAPATRISLGATLLLGATTGLAAQTVHSPLIPRGSLFLRMEPSATTVEGTYGSNEAGELPLGSAFAFPTLGLDEIPELRPTAERFGSLAGESETPAIRLGATVARFSADERVLPLQLSYGVLDRLTLGVTVPFIRKRVDTLLRFTPDGADVGQNPATMSVGLVSTFLNQAGSALATVETAVNDQCVLFGEQDPQCLSGRTLMTDAEAFLSDLDTTYQAETLFPLEGSQLGEGISNRWSQLMTQFGDWGAAGPETLPLATDPLDQATFESTVVAPAWPEGDFPLETPDVVLGLGDIELNVAFGLLRPDPPLSGSEEERGIQVSAAAVGTIRFATGLPDSLRTVSPIDPPRGVSGYSLRAVANLLLPGRLAILGIIEGGWNGTREMTLLAPNPAQVFTSGGTRSEVSWHPGSHIRLSLTPRFQVGAGLSLGAGWQLLRRQADEFKLAAGSVGESPGLPPAGDALTQHRLSLELRYTAMNEPLVTAVPFPFEILLRGSKSLAGTEWAAVETRAEVMVRFRLRD